MSEFSKIEWTDATWNPIRGCSLVSEGCRNCYAMRHAHRMGKRGYRGLTRMTEHGPVWTGEVRLIPEMIDFPLRIKKPRRFFVNSMSDLFHESVPIYGIAAIFEVMASCTAACGKRHRHQEDCWTGEPHTFQILTKRSERMREIVNSLPDYISEHYSGDSAISIALEVGEWPLPNVWLGVSVEDQKAADERIPPLLQTPAVVRWISAEPLLGPINISSWVHSSMAPLLDWVVVGGESGPNARPMHLDWARSICGQCEAAGVPFFMKQIVKRGRKISYEAFPSELRVREYPNARSIKSQSAEVALR